MRRVEATGDELCELASLREELSARADAERAVGMARYMRDLFPFLGVASTDRKAAQRSFISNGRTATSAELNIAPRVVSTQQDLPLAASRQWTLRP